MTSEMAVRSTDRCHLQMLWAMCSSQAGLLVRVDGMIAGYEALEEKVQE